MTGNVELNKVSFGKKLLLTKLAFQTAFRHAFFNSKILLNSVEFAGKKVNLSN